MALALQLQTIEDLAPDQSSLSAAKKLLNTSNWPLLGHSEQHQTIWGQCKGSGANPYLTMADVVDHGYKCTCPSRKFPCKHVLALMWIYSENPQPFAPHEPPEWVMEWMSRRRRSSASPTETTAAKTNKDISLTSISEVEPDVDPEKEERKKAQQQQRAEQNALATQQSIMTGLKDLELWINDQLRTGILGFCKELRERTRRIAARMVDAKASALASRIDELPAHVLSFPVEQQAQAAMRELGCWLLLSRAFQANPNDNDTRRAVIGAETRSPLSTDLASESDRQTHHLVECDWLCIGEQISNRLDGLISHSTYLWPLDTHIADQLGGPALLQDYYPASTGKRTGSLRAGTRLSGKLDFYPARYLLRATLETYQLLESDIDTWSLPSTKPLTQQFVERRASIPWLDSLTTLVGACQIMQGENQTYWLTTSHESLPLLTSSLPVTIGGPLLNACVRWNGVYAEMITAVSEEWGVMPC